jgi:N-acetylmuramoyl-L-alanine amidase
MPVNVVIDPGHGGSDTGAIGTRGTKEKDLVLDIANRIEKHLESYGVNTKLTRGKDSFLRLSARTAKADKLGADILVSVHLNSARNPDTEGIETYTLPAAGHPSTAGNDDDKTYSGNKNDKANTLLAYHVHKQMLALCGGADRGIRHARFDVLQNASCPAILVECGFISNKGEEAKLQQAEHREKIAKGITRGVLLYTGRNKTEQVNK